MTETAIFVSNDTQNREQLKMLFLQLLEEDAAFIYTIKSKLKT